MPVFTPGRKPAFKPLNRLRGGPFSSGRKALLLALNLTAMVDMFTVIVIFLLQNFSADGEIMLIQKDLKIPTASQAELLSDRGPVVTLFQDSVLWEGKPIVALADLNDADPDIPELTELFQGVREREKELDRRLGKTVTEGPSEGHAIIQADEETDFKLVRKVIYSINAAGWSNVNFVTAQEAKPISGEGEEAG